MNVDDGSEFQEFAEKLDQLLLDLSTHYGSALAGALFKGTSSLSWEQVQSFIDRYFDQRGENRRIHTLLNYVFTNPSTEESPYLYRLLSAGYLANSVSLEPVVSANLKIMLGSYELFLDSNILIPAAVTEMPGHESTADLLRLSREAGVKLFVMDYIFEEVLGHRNIAQRLIDEDGEHRDVLCQIIETQDSRANCFIQGFVAVIKKEDEAETEESERTNWKAYIKSYADDAIREKIGRLGVEVITSETHTNDWFEFEKILSLIKGVWSKRLDHGSRPDELNRHDANQFLHIYSRRQQLRDSDRYSEAWFLSHETVLQEVFRDDPAKWEAPPTFPVAAWALFIDSRIGVVQRNRRSIVNAVLKGASTEFDLPDAIDLVRRRAFGDRVPTDVEEEAMQLVLSEFDVINSVETTIAAVRSRSHLTESALRSDESMSRAAGAVDAQLTRHIEELEKKLEEERSTSDNLRDRLAGEDSPDSGSDSSRGQAKSNSQGPPFRKRNRRK